MDDIVFDFFMCSIKTEVSTHKFCIATSIILECQYVYITVYMYQYIPGLVRLASIFQ